MFLAVFAAIVIADQATKAWIVAWLPIGARYEVLPVFDLLHIRNPGIAFGLAQYEWSAIALVPVSALIIGWLVGMLVQQQDFNRFERWGILLIASGATGNLIDRIFYGAVVDFVYLHWGDLGFYVFNVADSAISIGVCLALWGSLSQMRAAAEKQKATKTKAQQEAEQK